MAHESYETFEAVKTRLDEIVDAVGSEDLPLDDALALYEEAVGLGLRASNLLETNIEAHEAEAEAEVEAEAETEAKAEALAEAVADAGAKTNADATTCAERDSSASEDQRESDQLGLGENPAEEKAEA